MPRMATLVIADFHGEFPLILEPAIVGSFGTQAVLLLACRIAHCLRMLDKSFENGDPLLLVISVVSVRSCGLSIEGHSGRHRKMLMARLLNCMCRHWYEW